MFAVLINLLSPNLVVVNKYLPSVSALKAIVSVPEVHSVITPLLPPVPVEILIGPFQMLSNAF